MPDLGDIDIGHAIGLPPERVIAYVRSKGFALTWSWRDMSEEAHALAFTVAKSAGYDVLSDIRGAVDKALAEGWTERKFLAELEPLLRSKGWWGRKGGAQLGSAHRLRTILRTNMRTARAAARYDAQFRNRDNRPLWLYDAVQDLRTRPSHAEMHGLLLPADHPAWQSIYPPNGFNCRCRVRALTEREAERMGLEVSTVETVPVDQDFGQSQTSTRAVVLPDGRRITPDPGFGLRPLPDIAAQRKIAGSIDRFRRQFEMPLDERIAAGRSWSERIAAIDSGDVARELGVARSAVDAEPRPVVVRAIDGLRRREILRLIEERRGSGVEATNVRGKGPKGKQHAARIRELSRLLPADWVRRGNAGGAVTVRAAGNGANAGSYNPRTKTIRIFKGGGRDSTLLHEYIHYLQEMHPEIDGLFWAHHRRQSRARRGQTPGTYRFRRYAEREYNWKVAAPTQFGSVGAGLELIGRARGDASLYGQPLELMTTSLETFLTRSAGSLDDMIRHDRDLFDLVLGLLLGSGP